MWHVTCVVFTADEVATIAKACRLIDIAFPPNTDPLVPAGRGVDPQHPLRRALLGLRSSYDLVSWQRVCAAREALQVLWDQVVVESSEAHWLELAGSMSADTSRHACVLATERAGQQRLVAEAMQVVEQAFASMSPADDVDRLREQAYA